MEIDDIYVLYDKGNIQGTDKNKSDQKRSTEDESASGIYVLIFVILMMHVCCEMLFCFVIYDVNVNTWFESLMKYLSNTFCFCLRIHNLSLSLTIKD